MSTIGQVESSAVASATQTKETKETQKKSKVSGKTVGNPQLSEKAAKYYEDLKKKFSNMDFILVSKDKKEEAKANAASYANPAKMVVLIDEDKIEQMAVDESYRNKYEAIIANASTGLSQMKSSLASNTAAKVKSYGMQVDDNGTATYFAVIDKSLVKQKERIEKKKEERAEEKKADKKKATKEAKEERLKESQVSKDEDTVTVKASSLEELLQKINDVVYNSMSDYVETDDEKQVGQHIDFRL